MICTKLSLLNNDPIQFSKDVLIYKPTLKDINKIGELTFFRGIKLLTITNLQLAEKNEMNHTPEATVDPYQFILELSQSEQLFFELQLIFITLLKSPVIFDSQKIYLLNDDETKSNNDNPSISSIERSDYPLFQKVIREIMNQEEDEEEYEINTDNEKMKKMFLEMRLRKKKAKEKQKLKNSSREEGIGLFEMVSAICTYNVGYNMQNIWDLTIYQLKEQFLRCQKKAKFEYDYQALLQGADSKKIHLKDWIK